jgi:RNA polymerase sigma-70 factor, ECF subfamily
VSARSPDPRARTASSKADLVERARAGDHAAFSILAQDSLGRVYGAAKLILRDQDRTEDAVQEALLLAWRHVAAIRDPDAWDSWLYRLTVRACYRLAGSPAARRVAKLDVRAEGAAARRASTEPDFTRTVVERARIMAALDGLPLEQRAVIVLHFYLDLPLTHAAAVLEVPPGTAKSRLHRGLETLRASLGEESEGVAAAMRERPA